MKILFINTTLNIGSTGRIVEQIAMKASRNGWDIYIAHGGRYVGVSQFESIQISSKWDNYLHAINGEFMGKHGLGSTRATERFIEIIKKLSPDVIHIHNIHGYYINYKVLFDYLAISKIPIIWTLHDCWAFTGHCTHFDNIACGKWRYECGKCQLLMAQYKSRCVDRSRKNYLLKRSLYSRLSNMIVVPVSYWLGNLVSDSILGTFEQKVIQNGIDLSVFKPTDNQVRRSYNIDDSKLIILGVVGSGFGPEKGKKEFVELARYDAYQIIIIGLTKDEARELPDNIIKLGRTASQKSLAEFYSAADILLNPTYNDTFPTINIESIACGTPVITYKTGGSPEILDENTGIIVEKGDIKGLIRAIEEIRAKGKNAYSQACTDRAAAYFNKDDRYVDYITLYDKMISNK